MEQIQAVYGFESKRDAQTKKNVGAKIWDAEIKDHSTPESLLIIVANGKVEYNASGPVYWGKEVTYRRATRAEWVPCRVYELEREMAGISSDWDDRSTENRAALRAQIDALKSEI
jgi:hypothetical protein